MYGEDEDNGLFIDWYADGLPVVSIIIGGVLVLVLVLLVGHWFNGVDADGLACCKNGLVVRVPVGIDPRDRGGANAGLLPPVGWLVDAMVDSDDDGVVAAVAAGAAGAAAVVVIAPGAKGFNDFLRPSNSGVVGPVLYGGEV